MPDTSQIAPYARLLKLTPVDGFVATPPETDTPASTPSTEKSVPRRQRKGLVSFLLLAVVPTCIAIVYFWAFAVDRYESEARFILRTPGRTLPSMEMGTQAASFLQTAGISRSNDDGYIVQEYLQSRDALSWIAKNFDFRSSLNLARSDPVWRFPNLGIPDTKEGLFWQFQRMVSVAYDNVTGVNTLKVQGFSADDAQRLTSSLLEAAEVLVNKLNKRAQRDAIAFSEAEAAQLRGRAIAAQAAITAFREKERIVDPKQVTFAVLETIARLSIEATQVSVQMNELMQSSPNSPQLQTLRTRRIALESQISTERQRLAGDAKSIAPRIAEYEQLMLEREFAEKALLSAMAAVEMARTEALRQQIYLERVSAPTAPDYPKYPWKLLWTSLTAVCGYMAWRIWRILAVDALNHGER